MLICDAYITWPKQFKPWGVLSLSRWYYNGSGFSDTLCIASQSVERESRTDECAV